MEARLRQTLARERTRRAKAAMKFREGTYFTLLGKDVTETIRNNFIKLCSICGKYEHTKEECRGCHKPICPQCIPDGVIRPYHIKCRTTFCARCCGCHALFRKNDMFRVSMTIYYLYDRSVERVYNPCWVAPDHDTCLHCHMQRAWQPVLHAHLGCYNHVRSSYRNIIQSGDNITSIDNRTNRLITAHEYDGFLRKGKTCPLISYLDGSAASHNPCK